MRRLTKRERMRARMAQALPFGLVDAVVRVWGCTTLQALCARAF